MDGSGSKEYGLWMLLLMCAGAAFAPGLLRSKPAAPPASDLRISGTSEPPPKAAPEAESRARLLRNVGPDPRVFLVSLPDPALPHTAVYYDEAIESIHTALQVNGYLPIGHWVPAPNAANAVEQRALCCGWSPEVEHRGQAGMLAFKHRNGRGLVVLIIPESPVSGVDRTLSAAAIDEAMGIRPKANAYVLGPFFSGSLSSLFEVFNARPTVHPVIVSGSANAPLADIASQLRFGSFRRTVDDTAELTRFVRSELTKLWASRRRMRMARLAEQGTVYGSAGEPATVRDTYTFPLHVAQLSAAHAHASKHDTEQQTIADIQRMLALELDPQAEDRSDLVPAVSHLTTHVAELALRNTLLNIARNAYDYLEIVATDPYDLLFLLRQARRYCPGTQLISYGPPLLISHPALAGELSGVLAATNYPLFLESQFSNASGIVRSFSSESSEGIYNAMLLLLSSEERERNTTVLAEASCAPACVATSSTCTSAEGSETSISAVCQTEAPSPPLRFLLDVDGVSLDGSTNEHHVRPLKWLTIVDNGRFWPLRESAATTRTLPRLPRALWFILSIASLWGLIHIVVLASRLWHAFQRKGPFGLAARAAPGGGRERTSGMWRWMRAWIDANAEHRQLELRYILVGTSLLALLLGVLYLALEAYVAASVYAAPNSHPYVGSAVGVLLFIASAALAIFSLFYAFAVARRCVRSWKRRWWSAVLSNASVLVGLAFVAWETSQVLRDADAQRWSVLLRTSALMGASPLSPAFFVVLGVYAWAAFGLHRLATLARFPRNYPASQGADPISLAYRRMAEFRKRSRSALSGGHGLALFVFAYFASWYWRGAAPSFEGTSFDRLFKFGVLILAWLVVRRVLQFLQLYRCLNELLVQLASEPLIQAFDRISDKISGSFGLQLQARVPSPEELQISVRTARLLASLALRFQCKPRGPLSQTIAAHARALDEVATAIKVDVSVGRDLISIRRAHASLFAAACTLAQVLCEIWRQRAEAPDLSALPKDRTALTASSLPAAAIAATLMPYEVLLWVQLAEDFVAMRHATFAHHTIALLRNMISSALTGAFLLLLAIFAYPFAPENLLRVPGAVLLGSVVAAAMVVILGLERNEVLSRLARTAPGRIHIGFSFLRSLALYGLLPIAALLIRFFPSLSGWVSSWLQPVAGLLSS